MPDPVERLRALHHGPPILVLPNAWDAATARLFEAEGFPAIATTSAGVAAALGYPDGGVVPSREMIEAVARIVRAVKVPVTADIEHAYAATPDAVAEVVLRVIAAGAVGINLEDYVPGADQLEPLALQVGKITTIIKAATKAGVRIVINARTDVFLRAIGAADARLDAAVARGKAYLAAGADCVYPIFLSDRAAIAAFVPAAGGPVNILGMPTAPPRDELAALAIVRDVARELMARGTYGAFTGHAMEFDEVNELMK